MGMSRLTDQDGSGFPTAAAKPKPGMCQHLSQLGTSWLRSWCCLSLLPHLQILLISSRLSGWTAPANLVIQDSAQFHHGDVLT